MAQPLYATPRSPNRPTRGVQIGKVGRALGQPPMPHQALIADVGGELLPDGTPAFREVIFTLMRQQGKTTIFLCFAVERCTLRGAPQTVAYTAQTGSDARKKLLNDQVPILERSSLWQAVKGVGRANDNPHVSFINGSRIDVLASTESAGHGRIIDLAELDEVFDDVDDRREQSMLPATITRRDAQFLIGSTMGTDDSVYLNRKVDAGRAAALEGRTSGIAYFEWAIPDDEDIDDPAVWWRFMPALGHTISEAAVAHARMTMSEGDFRRAFGNQRTKSAERVIPVATWSLVQTSSLSPEGRLTFALEVAPDRDWAAVSAAGVASDGLPIGELVDYRPGASWSVGRLVELTSRHGGRVAVESRGPAAALIGELRAAGVDVFEVSPSDVVRACGAFFDGVADRKLWIRADDRLDRAVSAASRKPEGDAWRFGRKAGGDVCPLNSLVLALHVPPAEDEEFFVY
jgi:hypothetical protein